MPLSFKFRNRNLTDIDSINKNCPLTGGNNWASKGTETGLFRGRNARGDPCGSFIVHAETDNEFTV